MGDYNDPVYLEDLGDGLFRAGGDIFCVYPIVSHTKGNNCVIYNFGTYTVTISWTESSGTKTNISWERVYANAGTDSSSS